MTITTTNKKVATLETEFAFYKQREEVHREQGQPISSHPFSTSPMTSMKNLFHI